jgi:two-component system osmolarity sensor histidine kinase EnvZ
MADSTEFIPTLIKSVERRKFAPDSLFARFVLIIVVPTVLLLSTATYVFYERHWENVTNHMQSSLIAEIRTIIRAHNIMQHRSEITKSDIMLVILPLKLRSRFLEGARVSDFPRKKERNELLRDFYKELSLNLPYKFALHFSEEKDIELFIEVEGGVIQILFDKKRITNSTAIIFVLWMVGAALLLFGTALIFMKNQVRSISVLATAADKVGRGEDIRTFKPSGAKEIRLVAQSFVRMQKRIERFIRNRTEMLAHISHDLRTPITRVKLHLAILEREFKARTPALQEVKTDLEEIETMITGYLNFAKGEGNEKSQRLNITKLVKEVVQEYNDNRIIERLGNATSAENLMLKEQAIKRALRNLISNALKHCSSQVVISKIITEDNFSIIIEDDGQGVAASELKEIVRPFHKAENSKGYGLGLAIVKSIVKGHGGALILNSSRLGGLKAQLLIPRP